MSKSSLSDNFFEQQLALLSDQGLHRNLYILPEAGGNGHSNGRPAVNFSSNDYLGLSQDQRLKDAAIAAIDKYGTGVTASRLLAGNLQITEELEADLARLMGTESALVFGSGFLTNLGLFSAITEARDEIFSDWLNHASIIDGIRLSHAHRTRYHHKDLDHLESLLKKSNPPGKRIIASESLFSMDGDIAPLADLTALARRYDALLVIDEAHAVGVMGSGGGVCRDRLSGVHPDIIVGTLSKALGGYGGFVACSSKIRDFLINKARSFIYSTGLPPASIAGARAAVSIINSQPGMGDRLLAKARRFREQLVGVGFDLSPFESQILPVPMGSNDRAVKFSNLLLQRGLFVRAIRPPTVPPGTARIRLSITLSMPEEVLGKAAEIMAEAAQEAGIIR